MIFICYIIFKIECICNNLKYYKLYLFYLVFFIVNNIYKSLNKICMKKFENDKNFFLFYKFLIFIKKYL